MGAQVFVENVSSDLTSEELADFFSMVGAVSQVELRADPAQDSGVRFALVSFRDPSDAEEAIETLDATMLDGERIRLRWAKSKDLAAGVRESRNKFERDFDSSSDFDDDDAPRGGRQSPARREESRDRDRPKPKKKGKHGSDRVHGRGTRRVVE